MYEDERRENFQDFKRTNFPLIPTVSSSPFFLSFLPSSFPASTRPDRHDLSPSLFPSLPSLPSPYSAITGSLSVVPLRGPSPAITYTTTRAQRPNHRAIHDHSSILDPNLSIRAGGAGLSLSLHLCCTLQTRKHRRVGENTTYL